MNKKPAISVVIPAYNEEKHLPLCLSALRKQTFTDFEVIVVDNNSKDKTAEIARRFGAQVVKETRQGMTPARERGFRAAKAEIIARTDADTAVSPNWLETIHQAFHKHPAAVGITGPWLSSSPQISDKIVTAYSYLLSVKLGRLITGYPFLTGPNMAVRKSAWRKLKVNTDDAKVHEDIDLSFHLGKVGSILWQPQMKVFFSFRRIEENPLKGLTRYLGEYPIRFIKTLSLNNNRLRELRRKRFMLKKHLLTKIFKTGKIR